MTKYVYEDFASEEGDELQCRQNLNTIFSVLLFEDKISKNTFDEMRVLLDGVGHNFSKAQSSFFDSLHEGFVQRQAVMELDTNGKSVTVFAIYNRTPKVNALVEEFHKSIKLLQ